MVLFYKIVGGVNIMMDLVIASKLKDYRKNYSISSEISDGIAFERFSNHTIVATHHPDLVDSDTELLDLVCVGGKDDMGIDGITIKFNGSLIKSISHINDILGLSKTNIANVEFIFIQSKYSPEFNSGEYGKFCDGIADFLSNAHHEPHNEKIEHWLQIKDYIFSEELFDKLSWEESPKVRIYYVSMGDWTNNKHIEGKFSRLADDIENEKNYGEVVPYFIDCKGFKSLRSEIDNVFSISIITNGELQLTDVDNIKKSSIFLCMADNYIPLLENSEGLIRNSIFFDNVRDFQGMTGINNEVLSTITGKPNSFILLNNGITIICDSFEQQNRRIKIKNPQIVNGCQTSHLIFMAYKRGIDISKVSVSIKLIETSDPDIINDIVKGTNKQNIVYDAAFETTKPFHKELEKFFMAIANNESDELEKIYYERRSKQFYNTAPIKQFQKINIRILIQSYISSFIKKPDLGHRHESILLKQYENTIFIEGQSMYQYFIASLLHTKYELFFIHNNELKKRYYTYKNHLMFIFLEIMPFSRPNINNKKQMDDYCKKIHEKLNDNTYLDESIRKSIQKFKMLEEKWIEEKGTKYKYGIKDSAEFTSFVLKELNSLQSDDLENVGQIVHVRADRHNKLYCHVKCEPENIFAHSLDNPDIDFYKLKEGQLVTYTISKNRFGKAIGTSMKIITE